MEEEKATQPQQQHQQTHQQTQPPQHQHPQQLQSDQVLLPSAKCTRDYIKSFMDETRQHFDLMQKRFDETMKRFEKEFDVFGNHSKDEDLDPLKIDNFFGELKLTKKQSSDIFDKLEKKFNMDFNDKFDLLKEHSIFDKDDFFRLDDSEKKAQAPQQMPPQTQQQMQEEPKPKEDQQQAKPQQQQTMPQSQQGQPQNQPECYSYHKSYSTQTMIENGKKKEVIKKQFTKPNGITSIEEIVKQDGVEERKKYQLDTQGKMIENK